MAHINKEFGISTWAIENRTTVFIVTFLLVVSGIVAYITMPREDFPEIKENKIFISSIFPGNSAEDVEKFLTKPLEKKLKNISNIQKLNSSSFQDFSLIVAECDDKLTLEEAKAKIQSEVDMAKSETDWAKLDNGQKVEPTVFNLNLSEEVPILNINVKGDYPKSRLKEFAEIIEDKIEEISEIKKADVLGVNDKEVEIAVDIYKMTAAQVSFDDIQRAVQSENMTMSAGFLDNGESRSNVRIVGSIAKPEDLNNLVVKALGGTVLLSDVAEVKFKEKEQTTLARERGKDVVMISVKKRSGTNMIFAIEKIKKEVENLKVNKLPKDIVLEFTADQSNKVIHAVNELSNHIIFGIILVMAVLMFALGTRNAMFVGSAIPISMLMAFAFLSAYGVTLNTMVLFALVMGLGMLVDDGIVVVDNVYANMQKGMSKFEASKRGIGEIAWPVISSTATTLAAFFPLGLWPGTIGKFMIYFPATLSVVLAASLIVALIINAAMTAQFMTLEDENLDETNLKKWTRIIIPISLILTIIGWIADMIALRSLGHFGLFTIGLLWLYQKFLFKRIGQFQKDFFPRIEQKYGAYLRSLLQGKKAKNSLFLIFGLLFLSFVLFGLFPRNILFFPENIPNQNVIYVEFPQGTSIQKTNQTIKELEAYCVTMLKKHTQGYDNFDFLVQSITAQVGEGGGNPRVDMGISSEMPYKGKITILYTEYSQRKGINTEKILQDLRANVPVVAGCKITVEKEENGPPVGYPISIQLTGDDYEEMIKESEKIISFINAKKIPGIERLQTDVNKNNPQIDIYPNKYSTGSLFTSTGQLAFALRRSIAGQELSTFKETTKDYKINMRLREDQRQNEAVVLNQSLTYRNQFNGMMMQVPIPSMTEIKQSSAFNVLKRKDHKRILTIYSNVTNGGNPNAITNQIKKSLETYKLPASVNFTFSGEQEEQSKNFAFLMKALLLALLGVAGIIILQFNSISKTVIIMATVLLSFSGVFFGLVFANMDFVILMTMMGIISLAGVVVKNGIVLMDFFVLILDERKAEYQVESHDDLPMDVIISAIVDSGISRLRPVLLTAFTAVLGLIPLAIGLNFDFFNLIANLNPHIYIGGDNVAFWKPLAWTIIFGLTYATVLTLVMVPVMFYLVSKFKHQRRHRKLSIS